MIEVYNGVYDKRVTGGMLMENDRITKGKKFFHCKSSQ